MKKFIKENWSKIVIVVIVIIFVSLVSKILLPSKETAVNQIANPASTNCIEKGGRHSIVDRPEGQVGICTLTNETVCEECQ
jgi:putative hemolysin